MASGKQRDTTKALAFVLGARNTTNEQERNDFLDRAAETLRRMDARTGRPDPSQRTPRKRPSKPAAK